VAAYQG